MKRYVSRWSGDLEDEVPDLPHLVVFEEDPVPTGLFDSQGNELFRVVEKLPVGFRGK